MAIKIWTDYKFYVVAPDSESARKMVEGHILFQEDTSFDEYVELSPTDNLTFKQFNGEEYNMLVAKLATVHSPGVFCCDAEYGYRLGF
jgi:hypothetical protein